MREKFMKTFITAIRAAIVLLILCGIVYPLVTTGFSQVLFPNQANGSLVERNGEVIGSELLAQQFTSSSYFHPRASAANYDPRASAATNAAVASDSYIEDVKQAVQAIEEENPEVAGNVPADLVTTSGSGFDPDLTPEAAKAQIPRIAEATGIDEGTLNDLVEKYTESPQLGVFGEERVNVLKINLALADL